MANKIKIKVRKFGMEDMPEVLEIEKRSFKDPYDMSTFLYFWGVEPEGFFVAEADGKVVGYVIASSHDGEIVSISVLPEFRRRGIGRRLMEEAMEYLEEKGVRRIELIVGVGNVEAIRFYEGLGFKKVSIIPRYYSDGEDGIKMVKTLDS